MRRLSALLLAAAAGCVRPPPPDLSRDPAQLLAQVRGAGAQVVACRGSARLSLSAPDRSGTLDAWVAAERPDRLRVEVLDFFGNPAAVLVAGGGRFALLDARAGIFYRGEDTPENLARLLPVPLGARELAGIVCGRAPILDGRAVAVEPGDGVALLELAGAAGRQVITVGEGGTVRAASFLPGARGGTAWKATFSDFRTAGGHRFPGDVDLRGGGAEIGLRWKDDLEVNGDADAPLFQLDPPKGAQVIDLAAGASPPTLDLPIRPAPPGAR